MDSNQASSVSDAKFSSFHGNNDASVEGLRTSNIEVSKRTTLILNLIMIVLCVLLILFSINTLLIGAVNVGVFNQKLVPLLGNADKTVNTYIALYRFVCASLIIGSFFAFMAALVGIASSVLSGPKFKTIRIILNIVFCVLMGILLLTNFLTICTNAAASFKISHGFGILVPFGNSKGVGWLLLGFEFLIVFHGGLIAFAILRLIWEMK